LRRYWKKKVLAQDNSSSDNNSSSDKPVLIIKVPAIEHFITNMVDTNVGIQLPALLHSIVEVFLRDGVTQEHVSDPDFMSYINKYLMSKRPLDREISSNIGRGVGITIDNGPRDSNRDPFIGLVPDKSAL